MNWTMDSVTDGIGMALILCGALLCLTAAVGLLRFRDLLTRMHAATKPQVLGVLLVLLGVALSKQSGLHIGMLLLVGVFQMLTIPVGAHMVGRAGFRTGQVAPSDVHLGPPREHPTEEEQAAAYVEEGVPGVPGHAGETEAGAGETEAGAEEHGGEEHPPEGGPLDGEAVGLEAGAEPETPEDDRTS